MEIIIQYAITDIRRFVSKYSYLHNFEAFSSREDDEDVYLKSTGESCYGKTTKNLLSRAVDFEAKKTFKINKWLAFCKKKKKEGIKIHLLSRKFHFDNEFALGIYEICFGVSSFKRIDYTLLVKELLKLKIRVPKVSKPSSFYAVLYKFKRLFKSRLKKKKITTSDFSQKYYLTTFGKARIALKRHYGLATSPKKHRAHLYGSLQYIKCNKPHIFIRIPYKEEDDYSIDNFQLRVDGLKYNVSLLHNLRGENEGIYQKINQVPVIKKSLNFVLENIKNKKICPKARSASSDKLQKFLLESIKKVEKKDLTAKHKSFSGKLTQEQAELEKILSKRIDVRRAVIRKVNEYTEAENIFFGEQKKKHWLAILFVVVGLGIIVAPFFLCDESVVSNTVKRLAQLLGLVVTIFSGKAAAPDAKELVAQLSEFASTVFKKKG